MANKIVKNYILSIINDLLSLLFPIITFPYITRILGPEKLGIINFSQSYGYYFMHIASFGISSYALREVSKVRDNKKEVSQISNEIFNINVFFSVLSFILYVIGVFSIEKFRANWIVLLILSAPILTNFLALEWLFQSYDDYKFTTIRGFFIRLITLISVFLFVRKEEDFIIYVLLSSITDMGSRWSALWYARKKYVNLKFSFKFLKFKKHISSLFTLFVFRLVNGISSNLDKLMIGFFLAYSEVGIYSTGIKFIFIIIPIIETVGTVLFPKINISNSENKEEYEKNIMLNYKIILFLGVPMAIGMFLVSPKVIELFAGQEFQNSVAISRIMSILILTYPIGDLLGSKTLLVLKKDNLLLRCSIYVAISNVLLNLIFIPIWGIDGAALATVISYFVALISRYYYSRKLLRFNFFVPELAKYLVFTIPFILIYIFFYNTININLFSLMVYVIICALIYVLELFVSKDKLFILLLQKIFIKR